MRQSTGDRGSSHPACCLAFPSLPSPQCCYDKPGFKERLVAQTQRGWVSLTAMTYGPGGDTPAFDEEPIDDGLAIRIFDDLQVGSEWAHMVLPSPWLPAPWDATA